MNNNCRFQSNQRKIKSQRLGDTKEIAGLTVTIKAIDFVVNPWGDEETNRFNHAYNEERHQWEPVPQPQYQVEIKKNGYSAEFQFTDSINSFVTKQTSSLESVLTCILDDYLSFENVEALDDWEGAEAVMQEFGYTDMTKARDVYRALHEAALKLKPIITPDEIYKLFDEGGELEDYR